MSRILLCWELGGGLGHLMQLRPIARGLVEGGHRVFAALKDLSRAGQIFGPQVLPLQAPVKTRAISSAPAPSLTSSTTAAALLRAAIRA